MFNEHQLLILMKERERIWSQEISERALLHKAKKVNRAAGKQHDLSLLTRTILRTLTIALLIILLALGLSTLARANVIGTTNSYCCTMPLSTRLPPM